MKTMVNVSCVQMEPMLADYQHNLNKMVENIESIVSERPDTDLIVFPELITTGYLCTKEEFQANSYVLTEDPSVRKIQTLAKKYNVYIVYGLSERDPDLNDVLYNSSAIISRDGDLMGHYRKVHPFDTEKTWCRAGCDFPVFEADFGKFGVMICWDTAFPEVARSYALKGADLLVVCTNWEITESSSWDMNTARDWDLITRARAFDNTLHLVAANRIGNDRGLGFFGRSKIIDPVGNVIESLDEPVEGIIHAHLDLTDTQKKRIEYYTFMKDRRPDTFDVLTKKY